MQQQKMITQTFQQMAEKRNQEIKKFVKEFHQNLQKGSTNELLLDIAKALYTEECKDLNIEPKKFTELKPGMQFRLLEQAQHTYQSYIFVTQVVAKRLEDGTESNSE
jgi:hypothetical protein